MTKISFRFSQYGDTPLHTSGRYGHAGVMRILVSANCNVSEQNKVNSTAPAFGTIKNQMAALMALFSFALGRGKILMNGGNSSVIAPPSMATRTSLNLGNKERKTKRAELPFAKFFLSCQKVWLAGR